MPSVCCPARGADKLEVRQARADDLDDIADIMCAAFPKDPAWDYRFPGRKKYPEDTRRCTRNMYEQFLTDKSDKNYLVKVVTDRGLTNREGPPRPIAVSVWELEYVSFL